MFETGQKVYHKNLKRTGIFDGYDKLDEDTCYVCFDEEHGIYADGRRVSIDQLVLDKFAD